MDSGIDTGPVLAARPTPIDPRETGEALLGRLSELSAELLRTTLDDLDSGRARAFRQDEQGAIYAPRLTKVMSPVRWDRDSVTVHNQIRALHPIPGTTSYYNDRLLKIGRAEPTGLPAAGAAPGTVLAVGNEGIEVACGNGRLRLLELQSPGRCMLPSDQFLRGCAIEPGQVFTS
jgi:methionyl-tRNA formyltransferase